MDAPSILELLTDATVKAAVLLLVAAMLTLPMRTLSAAMRHFIWTLALAAALLLPIGSTFLPAYRIPLLPHRSGAVLPALTASVQTSSTAEAMSSFDRDRIAGSEHNTPARAASAVPMSSSKARGRRAPAPSWEPWPLPIGAPRIIVFCWGFGTILVGAYWLVGFFAGRRMRRGAIRIERGPLFDALQAARQRLGVRRIVRLYVGPLIPMPMTRRTLRPELLVPVAAAEWPSGQLRSAMLHEVAHVKRLDCATQCLANCACAIYWFNPLTWLAAGRLWVERERACDDLVLHHGDAAPASYAEHLVAVARTLQAGWSPRTGAIAMARSSGLRQRVVNILDARTNRRAVSARAALVATAVALAAVVPLSCAQLGQRGTAAAPPAQTTPSAQATPPRPARPAVAARPATQPIDLPATEPNSLGTPLPTRTIRVIALDNATGQPLKDANVDYVNIPEDGRVKTDARGQATLVLRDGADPIISVWLSHYINQRIRWRLQSGEPPPADYVFRLDPVSPIGGKVVDDAGQPVAGANVEIYINGKMDNVGAFFIEWPWINRAVVTAADGTWSFDRVPPDVTSIKVAAWDYHHLESDYFLLKPYTPVSALRTKTAVLTLPRGVDVTGTVLNPFTGQAIPNATITFGADQSVSNKIPPLTAGADGKFSLGIHPGAKLFMTASAGGYRPEVHEEVVGEKPETLEFDLSPIHFVK